MQINLNKLSIKSRYRPEIDSLRAFAVIAVIINHFNKEILPNGYLGVDIFFLISGFVITSSLYQRPSKNFKDFISGFYERRIKRLVPALSVFVLIMSIAICILNPSPAISLLTGLTSLFGLSNLYLIKNSTDYFAISTEFNVFTHTWSLGVEEQFYILFPFLVWFSGFGRQTKNGARNLFLIVGALTITSLIGFFYLYPINQPVAYFSMPTRFWEMATGCLIFIIFQKYASIEQFLEKIPPHLLLILIIGVMYLPTSFATASTVAVVFLSAVLIGSLKKGTALYTFFTSSKIVYVGLISYSLYLWHWGILSISRWTIGIHWWSFPFQVALMFGLAISSYRYIETPLRKGNWFGKRWKTLLYGTGALTITSLSIVMIHETFIKDFLEKIGNKIYPVTYTIKPGVPHKDVYCHMPNRIENAIRDCLVPKKEKIESGNIFLIGDSHASNHYWSIEKALEQSGSECVLNTLVESGIIRHLTGEKDECYKSDCIKGIKDAGNAYKNFFREHLKFGDFILISLARDRFTFGEFKGLPRKQKYENLQLLYDRLFDLSQIAEQQGGNIILIGDIPKVCLEALNYSHEILRRGQTQKCTIEKTKSIDDRIGLNNVFIDIAKKSKSVLFVDPHDELCLEENCTIVNGNGVVLYADKSPHFTRDAKEILTNFWSKIFIRLGIGEKINP